jgi:pimeloyl-ACP methyl ester carboxylesterase
MNGRTTPASGIASRTAQVGGTKLHYLMAGHGPTVILLHGYAETSRMWKPLIPRLAERFTVIAPDLRRREGAGRRTRHRAHGGVCVRSAVSG